jgi:hypothetical protein
MFGEFQPTFGWRKGIHEQLKLTVFKECQIIEITPENHLRVAVRYLGMMNNIGFAIEKIDAGEDPNDKFAEELAAEYFNEKLLLEMAENVPQGGIEQLLSLLPPSIQKELSIEYGNGVTSVFKDNLDLAHQTSATETYFYLLYLGEYVEVFNTVDECYDYLATRLTTDELGGLTAFRALWTRIHKFESN